MGSNISTMIGLQYEKLSFNIRKVGLFVNCCIQVPMWSMFLCNSAYVALLNYTSSSNNDNYYKMIRYALLMYLPYIVLDRAGPEGRRKYSLQVTEYLRSLRIYKWVGQYFPVTLHKTCEIDGTNQSYIFLYHPHGVISMGANAALNTNGCGFNNVFPTIQRFGITLNACFLIPFFREWLLFLGFRSADKHTLVRILTNHNNDMENNGGKQHQSIILIPGGAAEALHATPGEMVLVPRKGFIKLALETNSILVPCIGYGENWAFETVKPSSHISKFQNIARKFMSFSIPVLASPFPCRHPINVVVGAPVQFPKDASIDTCQKIYMKEVENLYNEHKDKFGYGHVKLEWIL